MRAFLLSFGLGFLGVAASLGQQTPPPGPDNAAKAQFTYTGKPLVIAPSCRPEDINALGLACTLEEPCALYLELTDVETVGARVIVGGNLHTTATTLESILFTSEDGGRTWTEAMARIPGAGLDQMQFLDFENGWISGQALLALPRDPFFLITKDGGKTWRKSAVFSETRVGTIDSYWFESKTAGAMVIDRLQSAENGMRYERYESMTGGDSWSLRSVGAKLPVMKRPEVEPDVRVHADAASKTYRVEKRTAAGWQLLSRFAIHAGECKPPEPAALPEPPPTPEEPEEPQPPKPPAGRRPRR